MSNSDFESQLATATGKSTEKKTTGYVARSRKEKEQKAPSVKDNPFAQIAMSNPDPEFQKNEMVKLMTFVDEKTTAENQKALAEYSAYMQSERQRLAVKLIEMTDTKTFSNMQKVLVDINNGVLDFEEQIKPFMEIINAIRLIQEEDATTDILSEMREDGRIAEANRIEIAKINEQIEKLKFEQKEKMFAIMAHQEDKSFFGFGDVRPSAKAAISRLESEIEENSKSNSVLTNKYKEVQSKAKAVSTKFAHLAHAKEVMGTMLNLSEGDHEERHEQLVKTAVDFVTTTKERVSGTLAHSMQMGDQIKSLSDLAFGMRGSYVVLSEAAKEAELINSKAHDSLIEELKTIDDPLTKQRKEGISRHMSKHITALNSAARETTDVISDLTLSSQRIEAMEAANVAQIKKTEQIQTSGIAGVADNLSSVLTAINQAAIGQASTAAQQSLRRMNENTINLTKEQMLNSAKSQNDDNAALIKSLEQLAGFGDVIEMANRSTQDALGENREILKQMRYTADDVKKAATDTLEIVSSTITDEIKDAQE